MSGAVPEPRALEAARAFLSAHLPVTRLVPSEPLGRITGRDVYHKLESELPTGSFKPRGALWALAHRLERRAVREVVAASTGNHGAAVAWAARRLGVPATIFLPERPNPVKRDRILALGAGVVEGGRDLAAAFDAATAHAGARPDIYLLHDATDPDLPAGPGTIALEILEQLPDVETIVVPVGDTALVRGLAAASRARRPALRVVGVQAEAAPSYRLSWEAGRPVETETCDTIADGLATRTPVEANVTAIRDLVDDMALVSERSMLRAVRHLVLEEHLVAEPAGAAATAAVLDGLEIRGPTVLILSGANLSPDVLRAAATLPDEPRVTTRLASGADVG